MDDLDLLARMRTTSQLLSIVQAMRTLAGARVRQAQERFAGLERYARATRAALARTLALLDVDSSSVAGGSPAPSSGVRRVVVLFSEHGFVGALNELVLEAAERHATASGAGLAVVGGRGLRLCRERELAVVAMGAMPTTAMAAAATAQRLVEDLFGAIAKGTVSHVDLAFARHMGPTSYQPHVTRLFPPDVAAERSWQEPPIHTLPPAMLVAQAIEEYAFAEVLWAVAEAFASESAARLVAMGTSRRHIEERLSELRRLERDVRQETITNEILEVASGARSRENEEA